MNSRSPAAASCEDHLQWMYGRLNFEKIKAGGYSLGDFKLDRMRRLLAELGDPHVGQPAIHIAGSKGKGSVVHYVDAALRASGFKVGRFTSPHIDRFNERIAIDGQPIADESLAAAFDVVRPVVERLDDDGCALTFFEIGTALGWIANKQAGCDVVVLEVGLGGRLDSTNICEPIVTAIVSISHDHGHLLGHGLDEIAREKAGIFKPGVPAVIGPLPPDAREAAADVAATVGCRLVAIAEADTEPGLRIAHRVLGDADGDPEPVHTLSLGAGADTELWPRHQCDNLAVAIAILHELNAGGRFKIAVDDDAIGDAIRSVHVPLRTEVFSQRPRIILDVAHNGASVAALVATFPLPLGRRLAIFGTSSDKHIDDMLAEMKGQFDHVYLTEYSSNPRALPIADLAEAARKSLDCETTICETPTEAVDRCLDGMDADADEVLVFGSFFLASEVKADLTERGLL